MKKLAFILVATFIVVALIGVRSILQDRRDSPRTTNPPANTPQTPNKYTEDDGKQEDRWAFIESLVDDGTFQKVGYGEGGTLPKVWITDAFLVLSEPDQNRLLEVVYAYYNIADDNFGIGENVLIRDPLVVLVDDGTVNGRRVGTYDPFDGIDVE